MPEEPLTEREHRVLEAVIHTYVETAEPAGSHTIARRSRLGVSSATVRNTMSDLEAKGYLYHPHTSAGRVPTDRAYRFYVDTLLGRTRLSLEDQRAVRQELEAAGEHAAIEHLLRHAAQVLGLLTQELGLAVTPRLEETVLERLDLLPLAEGKVLLVLALRAGRVHTVYVDVPADLAPHTLASVATVLNERLAGHTLREIRATLPERLRDSAPAGDPSAAVLMNIFLQSADEWFRLSDPDGSLHLGRASVLAEQPEFQRGDRLRELIELTERRELLGKVLDERIDARGLHVTIGAEHRDAALAGFTVVTSEYRVRDLKGVIGVIGPTRMPYERVIAFVESTSALISEFLN